jgi:uncharacterized protein
VKLSPGTASLDVRATRRRGRGVFASCDFLKGECVEVSPVLRVSSRLGGALRHYKFAWDEPTVEAVAFGMGSLFNHSHTPNLRMVQRYGRKEIAFYALRDIAAGEECTIDYGYQPKGYDGR